MSVPAVLDLWLVVGQCPQAALLPSLAAPVVNQLVSGRSHQPGGGYRRRVLTADGHHCGHERLGGQVLGQRHLPASGQEVAVDEREGTVIEVQEGPWSVLG